MPSTLPQTSTTSFDEEIDSRSFRSLETASTLTLHADPFTHVDANHNAASDDEDAAGVKIAKASPPLPGMEQLKRQVQHIEDVFFVAPTGLESRLTVSDFRSLFDLLLTSGPTDAQLAHNVLRVVLISVLTNVTQSIVRALADTPTEGRMKVAHWLGHYAQEHPELELVLIAPNTAAYILDQADWPADPFAAFTARLAYHTKTSSEYNSTGPPTAPLVASPSRLDAFFTVVASTRWASIFTVDEAHYLTLPRAPPKISILLRVLARTTQSTTTAAVVQRTLHRLVQAGDDDAQARPYFWLAAYLASTSRPAAEMLLAGGLARVTRAWYDSLDGRMPGYDRLALRYMPLHAVARRLRGADEPHELVDGLHELLAEMRDEMRTCSREIAARYHDSEILWRDEVDAEVREGADRERLVIAGGRDMRTTGVVIGGLWPGRIGDDDVGVAL